MKTIILTVAVAVLGLTSCTKVEPVANQTELIQGEWNDNSIYVTTTTESFEPVEWLNVTIEDNVWQYEGSESVTFYIQDDVIYFSNGGTNEIKFLSADRFVLSKTLSTGNINRVVFKRN